MQHNTTQNRQWHDNKCMLLCVVLLTVVNSNLITRQCINAFGAHGRPMT